MIGQRQGFVSGCVLLALLVCVPFVSTARAEEAATGRICGTVVQDSDGRVLAEAGVEVLHARQAGAPAAGFALTNSDGLFVIDLVPGIYDLRITYPNCEPVVVRKVAVTVGKTTTVPVTISTTPVEIEEMRVVAKPRGDIELVQLMKRRTASNIIDNISAEMISKIPESDVAGILTRMPGVTVRDGKYMQARGMPKRYNRSLFNGSTLPTTKPNEKLVPLNLFPAGIVDSINVAKSYAPDLPANFSGGLCLIETKSIPDKFMMKVSSQVAYNSVTTGEDFRTYHGGSRDWLGFDDGTRDMPGLVPHDKVVRAGQFGGGGQDPETLEAIGESFQNVWTPYTTTALPSHDFSFIIGDRLHKAGYVFHLKYKKEFENRDEEVNYIYHVDNSGLQRDNSYAFERSIYTATIDALFNCGIELTPDHKLTFKNFYIHKGEDEVMSYAGFNSDIGGDLSDTRLRYIEEEIYSGQLSGDHYLYGLFDHKIDWHYTYSRGCLWEPDLREYLYEFMPSSEQFVFADESQSGMHMWTRQREHVHDMAVNWSIMFDQWSGITSKLKWGLSHLRRDREFWSRRFRFMHLDTTYIDTTAPVEEILQPWNINQWEMEIQETTRSTDTYEAEQRITSLYVMLELPLASWVRISGGGRYEHSTIDLLSYDLFDPGSTITTNLKTIDWFPAFNITFQLREDMNLRLGYSETTSRPEFHELAPFEFTDVRGGRAVKGNPDLQPAYVRNYDFRWEWFVNEQDLLAVSLFYKDFEDAIEKTIQPTIELRSSYVNSSNAWLMGAECELRKNLGFVSDRLQHWNVIANYIYTDSEAEIDPSPGFVPTNLKRPMVGQAEHTFNATLEYSNPAWGFTSRLMYQYVDERVHEVGGLGLPDIMLESQSRIDFVLIKKFWEHLELKIIGENLTDENVEYTQGGEIFQAWDEGVTWKVKLSYTW